MLKIISVCLPGYKRVETRERERDVTTVFSDWERAYDISGMVAAVFCSVYHRRRGAGCGRVLYRFFLRAAGGHLPAAMGGDVIRYFR